QFLPHVHDDRAYRGATRQLRIGKSQQPLAGPGFDRLGLKEIGDRQELAQIQAFPPRAASRRSPRRAGSLFNTYTYYMSDGLARRHIPAPGGETGFPAPIGPGLRANGQAAN